MTESIRILKPGDEQALEAFLLPRIDTSMFLVGNMRSSGLEDNGETYQGTYAAAFSGERITSVVAHCWNNNLIIQAPNDLETLWHKAVQTTGRPIGGMLGPDEQVSKVMAALDVDDSRLKLNDNQKLYSLELDDLVIPDELETGRFIGRPIEARDLELITKWIISFRIEAMNRKDSLKLRDECRTHTERRLHEGRAWILEDGGKPVATSGFNAAFKEAVQVGGVYTPPELRARRYGRAAVAATLLDVRAEGVKKAILFTPSDNFPAQRAYTALGFQHIGGYRLVLIDPPVEVA